MSEISKIKIIENGIETVYGISGSGTGGCNVPADIANNFELSGSSNNNMTIKSAKHINLESMYYPDGSDKGGDIQLKPGDDITLYSHHRDLANRGEVSLKVLDGNDVPAKLKTNLSELTLTTKGKAGTTPEVLDIMVNSDTGTRGYLKVRAQAIDLRSETHGGIALQPKGKDSAGNMNKIKFEHGGGDGLEFGTFNTEKSSLFTDEYRFNRNGDVKMATRSIVNRDPSDVKYDAADTTTQVIYEKQADDFYDVIDPADEVTTWHDIIKTAYALNRKRVPQKSTDPITGEPIEIKPVETEITNGGNLRIKTRTYTDPTTNGIVSPKIILDSADDVEVVGDNITASATGDVKLTADGAARLSSKQYVTFDETPVVMFLTNKVTKTGKYKSEGTVLKTGVLNNLAKEVYLREDGKIQIKLDELYTDLECTTLFQVDESTNWVKTPVYEKNADGNGIAPTRATYFMRDIKTGHVWYLDIDSSGSVKQQSKCEDANPDTNPAYANVVFVEKDASISDTCKVLAPETLVEGTASVSPEDIILLVNWMKANKQGPWVE